MKPNMVSPTRPRAIQTVRSQREQQQIDRLAAQAFGLPISKSTKNLIADYGTQAGVYRMACGCWSDALRADCGHKESA